MKERDNEFPSMKKLLACMQRKLPVNDPENKYEILYHLDALLPRASGCARAFDKKVRCHATISDAKMDEKAKEEDITAETEAFAMIVLENNCTKWPTLFVLEDKPEKKGKKTKIIAEKTRQLEGKRTHNYLFCVRTSRIKNKMHRSKLRTKVVWRVDNCRSQKVYSRLEGPVKLPENRIVARSGRKML